MKALSSPGRSFLAPEKSRHKPARPTPLPPKSDGAVWIPLTQGRFALVDEIDADAVLARSWYAKAPRMSRPWYVMANAIAGDGHKIYLHRFIAERAGLLTSRADHIKQEDHDGLNCRRSNLLRAKQVVRSLLPHPTDPALTLVPLANAKGVAVVDTIDAEEVGRYNWQIKVDRKSRTTYATRNTHVGGHWSTEQLHRLIGRQMGFDTSSEVDHKDHDGLNDRRTNLRPSTRLENSRNGRRRTNSTSGFKGVSRGRRGVGYRARICINGKETGVGIFSTAVGAALAYDRAALEHFGEFAHLNFKIDPQVEALLAASFLANLQRRPASNEAEEGQAVAA